MILPLLTSVVVRALAWIVILGRQGILDPTRLALGLVADPRKKLARASRDVK